MTEAEWYDHDPPWELRKVPNVTSPRKIRLFMAGSIRVTGAASESQHHRRLIELAEEYADGRGTKSALTKARSELRGQKPVYPSGWGGVDYLLWCALNLDARLGLARFDGAWMWAVETGRLLPKGTHQRDALSRLMREVFANPFRSVAFAAEWRTDTAVTLAQQMYASRDFSGMPILADALQDAGCDNEDILAHCRGDGPHVRGCWVVDLVLGKS